jgi:hypothetical protein
MAEELQLAQQIVHDADYVRLRTLSRSMATRLGDRGYAATDLARAAREGRLADVADMMGLSVGELMLADAELRQAAEVVLQRYPRISLDASAILERARARPTGGAVLEQTAIVGDEIPCDGDECEDDSGCRVIPYLAALAVCTAFGSTPLYFACALLALCEFCTGGLAALVC